MALRRLVAILIAVVTALSWSVGTRAAFSRAAVAPERCGAPQCPWDRAESEAPEPCCEEAPPVTIARRSPLRVPGDVAPFRASYGDARPLAFCFVHTAVIGCPDRTLLGQRTLLLH